MSLAQEMVFPTEERGAPRIGLRLFLLGLAVFSVGVYGLVEDILWIAQPFYAFAWWGYIFMLDGFCSMKRGSSILTTRRRHFWPMVIWSITFWYLFEALNLRYQNWYYVGAFQNLFIGYVFGWFAFGTVLIGMFETYEAVCVLGFWKNWKGKPRQYAPWVSYAWQGLGLTMLTLSVVFPTYLAPLIWGSLTFIVDPWNYRNGRRSLLKDLERRDWGTVARIMFGGLVCGAVWESMNFFAPQKWIYTVRGLENFKLFEMPLLGFLGFPALALDGMAFYSFLSYVFLGNESWEHPDDLGQKLEPTPQRPRSLFWKTVPFQLLFWAVTIVFIKQVNTGSYRMDLTDLPGLSPEMVQPLEAKGVTRPRHLLIRSKSEAGRKDLEETLALADPDLDSIIEEAELFTYKGIGAIHGPMLQSVGITNVRQLEKEDPAELHQRLVDSCQETGERPPRLDMVRVWVLAARNRGIVMRAEAGDM
ncbi:MAG: DUF4332 domain-containing protein [Candidatus Omnitrophica bacterium]|nr:DUF4332 domain-containing protein [Candidatus Omnitrophota bacterium]